MAILRKKRWVVHCKRAPYDVYIGRGRCPVTGILGFWGNPFVIGTDGDRAEVLAKYEDWLCNERPDLVKQAQKELRGKVLGCWCAPQACHGDILHRVANEQPSLNEVMRSINKTLCARSAQYDWLNE